MPTRPDRRESKRAPNACPCGVLRSSKDDPRLPLLMKCFEISFTAGPIQKVTVRACRSCATLYLSEFERGPGGPASIG